MFAGRFVLAVIFLSASLMASDVAFEPEIYRARRDKLAAQIRDGVAIVSGFNSAGIGRTFRQDPTFWYLTGVESPYAILVMAPRQKRTVLFLPAEYQLAGAQYPMIEPEFRKAVWNRPVRRMAPGPEAQRQTGISETYPIDEFVKRLPALVEDASKLYVSFEETRLYSPPGFGEMPTFFQQFARNAARMFPDKPVENLFPLVQRLRLVKDAREIETLRHAAAISVEGINEAMRSTHPGMTELEVAGLMEYVWKKHGAQQAAFAPIVGSGPNSMVFFTLSHENYNALNRTMRAGELLFLDYGAAEYNFYTTDLCRTLPVSGKFSAEQRKYYDIVLEALDRAIAEVKPGAMMVDIIKKSAEVFQKHGFEPYENIKEMGPDRVWGIMPSPTHYLTRNAGIVRYSAQGIGARDLGHHIGLEVQDGRDYSMPLEPGMVFTMEPKIYIPEKQIAIMIEDMILVTPTGHDNLTAKAPRRASDIDRMMAQRGIAEK